MTPDIEPGGYRTRESVRLSESHLREENGAPRPMKMGTIASSSRYGALQSTKYSFVQPLWRAPIDETATARPSIAALSPNSGFDVMGQEEKRLSIASPICLCQLQSGQASAADG